jgi:hypothetical protein
MEFNVIGGDGKGREHGHPQILAFSGEHPSRTQVKVTNTVRRIAKPPPSNLSPFDSTRVTVMGSKHELLKGPVPTQRWALDRRGSPELELEQLRRMAVLKERDTSRRVRFGHMFGRSRKRYMYDG